MKKYLRKNCLGVVEIKKKKAVAVIRFDILPTFIKCLTKLLKKIKKNKKKNRRRNFTIKQENDACFC